MSKKKIKRAIKLAPAEVLKIGDFILKPQCPMGILLMHEVTKVEFLDDGERVEVETSDGILNLLSAGDIVAVV